MPSTDDPSRRLLDAFLALDDVPRARLATSVYHADEMLRHMRSSSRRPDADLVMYFATGRQAARCAERVLARVGRRLQDCRRILDFACGAGRITRYFAALAGAESVTACDLDPPTLAFVEREMGVRTLLSHVDPDAVTLPGDNDLVFVGSLFTHLPEQTFARWLRVLFDSLADDGMLLFSTHGTAVGSPAHRAADFAFYPESETDRIDKNVYGSTHVSPARLRSVARSAGIEHVHVMEQDLWYIQDLSVASRRAQPALRDLAGTGQLHVGIHEVRFVRPDHIWVCGQARSARGQPRPRDVRLFVDGVDVCGTSLAPSASGEQPGWVQTDWYTEGPPGALAAGPRTLVAVVEGQDGIRTVGDAWWVTPPA